MEPNNTTLYKNIYLGIVYDSMRLLGYRAEQYFINIKPKAGYDKILIGPAFTTYGEIVKSTKNYKKLDNIRLKIYNRKFFNNNPVVLLQANDTYCAHSGDITLLIYKTLGAKGFITDGNVRDLDIIDNLKFPVFCKDSNPIDAINYWAITRFNKMILLDNVEISPGDLIFASKDGVIRVPNADIERFTNRAIKLLEKEEKVRQYIFKMQNEENLGDHLTRLVEDIGRW